MKRSTMSRLELLGMTIPRKVGFVPKQLHTRYEADGRPVYLIHNPKAAGSSLKALLCPHKLRTLHIWARGAFRKSTWRNSVVVCGVREPLSRFVSSYNYHVVGPYKGALYRLHGEAFKTLSVDDYFELMRQYPEYLGPQANWYAYPDAEKPVCDVILRVEESKDWLDQLAAAGIAVEAPEMPERNVSQKALSVGMLEPSLRRRLQDYYAEDYDRLGYSRDAA